MYHDLSKVDGLWGCSEFGVISFIVMNDPTMGLPAQVFVWICVFTALPASLCDTNAVLPSLTYMGRNITLGF